MADGRKMIIGLVFTRKNLIQKWVVDTPKKGIFPEQYQTPET